MPAEEERKGALPALKSFSKKKGRPGGSNRDRKVPAALGGEVGKGEIRPLPPGPAKPRSAPLLGGRCGGCPRLGLLARLREML